MKGYEIRTSQPVNGGGVPEQFHASGFKFQGIRGRFFLET